MAIFEVLSNSLNRDSDGTLDSAAFVQRMRQRKSSRGTEF